MHDAKKMAVELDLGGPIWPIRRAFEGIRVADLDVKGRLLFGQALSIHESEEEIIGFFRTEQVDVRAQKGLIHEKLDGGRAKDGDFQTATQKVYTSKDHPSYLKVRVM